MFRHPEWPATEMGGGILALYRIITLDDGSRVECIMYGCVDDDRGDPVPTHQPPRSKVTTSMMFLTAVDEDGEPLTNGAGWPLYESVRFGTAAQLAAYSADDIAATF